MPKPLATWNSARGVWETARVALCGHSEPYSAIWPSSGMTRAGRAYELPTSAPHMGASASSSLLGTPRAAGMPNGGSATLAAAGGTKGRLEQQVEFLLTTPDACQGSRGGSQHPDKRAAGGHAVSLTDVTEHLLPTPRATDGTNGGPNQRGTSGDLMLPSAVMPLLPTLAVNDMGAGKTPEAWDEWTERMQQAHGNGNGHGKSLEIEALRLLPTPTAMDSKASGGSTPSDVTLTDAIVRTSLGDSTNPRFDAGSTSSDD